MDRERRGRNCRCNQMIRWSVQHQCFSISPPSKCNSRLLMIIWINLFFWALGWILFKAKQSRKYLSLKSSLLVSRLGQCCISNISNVRCSLQKAVLPFVAIGLGIRAENGTQPNWQYSNSPVSKKPTRNSIKSRMLCYADKAWRGGDRMLLSEVR